jgi:hypothetical protein
MRALSSDISLWRFWRWWQFGSEVSVPERTFHRPKPFQPVGPTIDRVGPIDRRAVRRPSTRRATNVVALSTMASSVERLRACVAGALLIFASIVWLIASLVIAFEHQRVDVSFVRPCQCNQ